MDEVEISKKFEALFDDLFSKDLFECEPGKKPFLAHYTSLKNLESILNTEELWFSNPLFMNDLEEVRFGVFNGMDLAVEDSEKIIENAFETADRYAIFKKAFNNCFDKFKSNDAFDTYVFCLSEHDQSNNDGLLSMWRGYGNHGNGAAIIFNSEQIKPIEDSPLVIIKVDYQPREIRLNNLKEIISSFTSIVEESLIDNDKIYIAAHYLFERIKYFALSEKHIGFSEEKEWRVIYDRNRDHDKKLDPMFSYVINNRGIEPKLKFKMAASKGITSDDFSFEKIIHSIILGPSLSSELTQKSVLRMLESECMEKSYLKDKVFASTIPLRPE